jgi:peptidoglycan hydrolase-like protein with peptidoglycan-binding domain
VELDFKGMRGQIATMFSRGTLAVLVCIFAGIATLPADELIRAVQKKLAEGGYYKGGIDGDAGSMTHAAIRRFQLAEKLKVTGEINHQTLERLGLESIEPAPDYTAIGRFFPDGPLASEGINRQVAAIRSAQEKLAAAGLYAGPHNGMPGGNLSAALREWQSARGLAASGKLDSRTAKALEIEAR